MWMFSGCAQNRHDLVERLPGEPVYLTIGHLGLSLREDDAGEVRPPQNLGLELGGVFEHIVDQHNGGNASIFDCGSVMHGR